MELLVLVSICGVCAMTNGQRAPRASTRFGDVEGFTYRLENGDSANIFLGIPYASPPVRILRFERPVPVRPWTGIKKTIDYGASCYPYHRDAMVPNLEYDEDCLYMNVFAPSRKSDSLWGYPVVVIVHGGGFKYFSSSLLPHDTLCNNFVKEGIIVVTFNYRVGFLGFLSTGEGPLPGNLGLWDQTEALVFVSENIPAFGGDPRRVTLLGQGAGAASISALSISPKSNEFFQQSITFSGSIFCEFALSQNVISESFRLINALGCANKSHVDLKDCMKRLSVHMLLDGMDRVHYDSHAIQFHPKFDTHFFVRPRDQLLQVVSPMRNMIGVHGAKSAISVLYDDVRTRFKTVLSVSQQATFSVKDLRNYIRNVVATEEVFGERAKPFEKQLVQFYVERAVPENMINDITYNVGIFYELQLKQSTNWTTFLFTQDYHNPQLYTRQTLRVEFEYNHKDVLFKQYLLSSIRHFIKTGSPTISDSDWLPTDTEHPFRHLRMTSKPKMREHLKPQNTHFWRNVSFCRFTTFPMDFK
ncbi:unnamed protein product [Anisakis simplex]|uniref:COesterase domain-containing protein n=2 Tax=Anisakis simplex TaxID=6269 RepID=A0A0M3IZ74_ANISI|nr:unnamed protein product [Anisakis simplex]